MRIFKAEDFVMLDEIDAIDLQALQDSSICLRLLSGTTVDFRH